MGLVIQSVSGYDGQVELAGVRAVIGIFLNWTIKRRGETPSGTPSWTLRAVFSYQKDSLLNSKQRKVIKIKYPSNNANENKWYEVKLNDGVEIKIEQNRLVIEGAILCPVEPPK